MDDDVWSDGYAYEQFMGRWSRVVAPRFLRWLDAPSGLRWVDVGCGTGALAAAVVNHAAPRSVLATDPAAGMLEEAALHVSGPLVRFERSGVEELSPGSCDVAVSGLVINFLPNPLAAVATMARAAAGGVVAAYVWDYAGRMEMMRTFWDVACSLDPAAVDSEERRLYEAWGQQELADTWAAAGLGDVGTVGLNVSTVFADFDDLWTPFLCGNGWAPGYVMSLGETDREVLRRSLEEQLTDSAHREIRLTARAWAVRGTSSRP